MSRADKNFFEKTSSNSQFRNQNFWYFTTLLLSPRRRSNFQQWSIWTFWKRKSLFAVLKGWRQFQSRKTAFFSNILLPPKSRDITLSNEPHQSITRQMLAILNRNKFLQKFLFFKLYSQNKERNADLTTFCELARAVYTAARWRQKSRIPTAPKMFLFLRFIFDQI